MSWLFSSCDYAAQEMCTLAQICFTLFGKSAMRDAINAGQDLHARLASTLLNVSYEEGLERKAADDKVFKNMRQAAKPVNFGLPGLMGAPKLVYTARKDGTVFCELAGVSTRCLDNKREVVWYKRAIAPTCCECLELAVQYIKAWKATWPEVKEYHELTKHLAELALAGQPAESFGTGMMRLETNASAISNHFFQNLAAQCSKRALYSLQKEAHTDRKSVLYGNLHTVVFMHDETFCEVRESVAHECAFRQAEIMKVEMQALTPDVLVTVEPSLMRRWFKGAEKAFDRGGRLKPWWPVNKKCKWPEHVSAECGCWKWAPDQEKMRADLDA